MIVLLSILVELGPKVTTPTKVACPFDSIVTPEPTLTVSNVDIPVGKMILFPGQLTHGHECLPLTAGVKYSLTIWTCRYVGDTI